MEIEVEALLCAMSRVLVNHPAKGCLVLKEAGSLERLLKEGSSYVDGLLKVEGVGEMLFSREMMEWGRQEALWMRSKGVKLISVLSDDYPSILKECPDPPFLLYYRGSASFGSRIMSIVGTRVASPYGAECVERIVADIAQSCSGVQIVSGLALGIDGCAHKAALEAGLETIAVLPCGIDWIYPSAHREMAVRMLSQGGVVTEYPRGTKPLRRNFLQRNRIIAGICNALLVGESRISGGSMSTVEYASSYNKDIFAVPGRMWDANSYGCNYLISRNVAQLCLNSSTIIKSMGWTDGYISDIKRQPSLFSASEETKQKLLLSLSAVKGRTADWLCATAKMDIRELSLVLLEMEMDGQIRKDASGLWYKA
ncbi:MAG: DNA-processing protein DprA [Bacteroidales bacterium]|nr:DNA-processing protein DprA [Bacteroidales bacterium]